MDILKRTGLYRCYLFGTVHNQRKKTLPAASIYLHSGQILLLLQTQAAATASTIRIFRISLIFSRMISFRQYQPAIAFSTR